MNMITPVSLSFLKYKLHVKPLRTDWKCIMQELLCCQPPTSFLRVLDQYINYVVCNRGCCTPFAERKHAEVLSISHTAPQQFQTTPNQDIVLTGLITKFFRSQQEFKDKIASYATIEVKFSFRNASQESIESKVFHH